MKEIVENLFGHLDKDIYDGGTLFPNIDLDEKMYDNAISLSKIYNIFEIDLLLEELKIHLNICININESINNISEKIIYSSLGFFHEEKSLILSEQYTDFLNSEKIQDIKSREISNQSDIFLENNILSASPKSFENQKEINLKLIEELNSKNKIAKQIIDSKKEIYSKESSPLNFVEKYIQEKHIFVEEFKKLLSKSFCISNAADVIFNIDIEFPKKGPGLLNRLNIWYNKIVDLLEIEMTMQQKISFTIPISHEKKYPFHNCPPLLRSNTNFKDQRDAGELIFHIPENLFHRFKNVRLAEIGFQGALATKVPHPNGEKITPGYYEAFHVEITPPVQKMPRNGDIVLAKAPLRLSTNPTQYRRVEGKSQAYFNISPIGEWRLTLPATSIEWEIPRGYLGMMYLYIDVIATPDESR